MSNKKPFVQDVLTLTSVPIISQILGLLLTPIVTRLYAPEAFGLANVFGQLVMIVAVFTTLGYHGAIVLPKTNKTATYILFLCFYSTIIVSVISFFISIVVKDIVPYKLNAPDLVNYLWLTPIFVFVHGLYQSLRFWKTRLGQFDNLAISRVGEIIMKKSYQIPVGFLGYATADNLIYADLFAAMIKIVILAKNICINTISYNKAFFLKLWVVAKKYRKFPKYSVWSEIISRLPELIVAFLIIKYFGKDMLGYYSMCLFVLAMPSILIRGSIIEAFSPRVAMAKHDGKHAELLEKLYVPLASLMMFPFMVLGLFSEQLFPFIFGSEWIQSGLIAKILLFRIFMEIIFSPSFTLIDVMGKQVLRLIRTISSTIIAIVALMLGAYYNNFYLGLWILSVLQGLSIIIIGGYMMWIINFSFLRSIKRLSRFVLLGISINGLLLLLSKIFIINNIYLILVISVGFLIYYIALAYMDHEIMNVIKKIVKLV